jgi:hypothetical protein
MPLTDAAIRRATPAEKPYRLFDERGLYLEVSPSGGRWWRLKYRFAHQPGALHSCRASAMDLGQRRNESHIDCLQLDVNESEALLWLIERHKRVSSLNDFSRILLTLELEPVFKERAASNRSRGGREKGSSNLSEADHVDVRSEIAKAAGVSVGKRSAERCEWTANAVDRLAP